MFRRASGRCSDPPEAAVDRAALNRSWPRADSSSWDLMRPYAKQDEARMVSWLGAVERDAGLDDAADPAVPSWRDDRS